MERPRPDPTTVRVADPALDPRRESIPPADVVLAVRNVTKTYGGVVACDDVSFDLRRGEILALAGENGAGKSTIIGVMAGSRRQDVGEIIVDGQVVLYAGPAGARARGIGVVYQEAALVPHLSVEENVLLGDEPRSRVSHRVRRGDLRRRYQELLTATGISLDGKRAASSLSVAERQLVQVLRVVAIGAHIMILDEPTAALSPEDRDRLFQLLQRLRRDRGASFILVSHFLEELEEHCDRAVILRNGRVSGEIASRPVSAVVLSRMMARERIAGGHVIATGQPLAPVDAALSQNDGPALQVRGVLPTGARSGKGFDLEVQPGEIVGIAGLVGSGRTEILRAIALGRRTGGEVDVLGRRVRTARQAVTAGLLMLPEDRRSGLQMDWSLWRNVSIASLDRTSSGPLLRARRERQRAVQYLTMLSVRAAGPDAKVSTLSGGNQQKVAFARILAADAPVVLLDEPTHGIDIHTKAEILDIIGRLARQGRAFVMVAAEFGDLLDVCSTILTLHKGEIVGRHVIADHPPTVEDLVFEAATGRPVPRENAR